MTGPHPLPNKCPYCEFLPKNFHSLILHATREHKIKGEQLTNDLYFESQQPACVCGEKTSWKGVEKGYNLYCVNCNKKHAVEYVAKIRRENYKPAWNAGLTKHDDERIAKGGIKSSKTKFENGVWNAGLTKETDARISQMSDKIRESLNKRYEIYDGWSKGLTKETDERVKRQAEGIVRAFSTASAWQRMSEESREKVRKSASLARRRDQRLTLTQLQTRIESLSNWELAEDILTETWRSAQISTLEANVTFKCTFCGLSTTSRLYSFFLGRKCSCQKQYTVSAGENELSEFLLNHGYDLRRNVDIIKPFEIDIFLPENKLAIEFNGLYWHSTVNNASSVWYHEHKRLKCIEQNVQLFHVYEDEWNDRKSIIQSMLLVKLMHPSIEKLHARNCKLEIVSTPTLKTWFEETHIDGYANSKIGFALKLDDKIVAALALRRPLHLKKYGKNTLEIARFSSKKNTIVRGAFSKLLSYAKKWAVTNGYNKIISYQDLRFGGSGNCYATTMKFSHYTHPSWWWTDFSTRENRFFIKATKEKTEKELSKELGYYKIGGCALALFETSC